MHDAIALRPPLAARLPSPSIVGTGPRRGRRPRPRPPRWSDRPGVPGSPAFGVRTRAAPGDGSIDPLARVAGGVSHDLANLLSVALSALGTVDPAALGDDDRDAVGRALDASGAAARLAAQFQRLVRRQVPTPEALDANEIVLGTSGVLRSALGERVALEHRLCPPLWAVRAEPVAFENALVNLVVNARDAIEGRGRVTIETANVAVGPAPARGGVPAPVAGDRVRVSVRDTGRGIAEADRARVFERHYSTKPAERGSGLGLSSVADFAAACGGSVTVEGAPGCGCTVSLWLPALVDG